MEQVEQPLNMDYLCSKLDSIATTCNDNLKGLTSQHVASVRATKADAKDLCSCSSNGWSEAQHRLNVRLYINDGLNENGCDKSDDETHLTDSLDIADIRGPCGETGCRIANDMRNYIEDLAEEDNKMINLDELVGPCGKPTCMFINNLKDFILHRGVFASIAQTDDPNRCCCAEIMQKAITRTDSSESFCSPECEEINRNFWTETGCVHKQETTLKSSKTDTSSSQPKEEYPATKSQKADTTLPQNIQNLYYFTIKVDPINKPSAENCDVSGTRTPPQPELIKSETKFKHCAPTCPKSIHQKCSKSACDITETGEKLVSRSHSLQCIDSRCSNKEAHIQDVETPSPADSDVEINLADLRKQCNVESCQAAERLMEYIIQGLEAKKTCPKKESCFCDCSRCKNNI
ncbi:hypothetical protein O0L34_g7384 [Tuta absoluta]|nr:hypothetical protein O0L34_g7384 [Tuta absoluta]